MVAEVLLIDDEVSFGTSLQAVLTKRYGIAVDYATTWDEGVGMFRVGQHELVVADYNLPGALTGLKLLVKIKQLRPSTRLILISGVLPDNADKVVSLSPLVDRYVPKSPERMIDVIVEEARAAAERATHSSDWPGLAAAHLASGSIDFGAIDEIDKILSAHVPGGRA